jgi:hypothetical protein
MLAPNAETIEGAADNLLSQNDGEYPGLSDFIYNSQLKELESAIGADTAKRMGVTFPLTTDFIRGYMLGLQTARMTLIGSVALALAKVKPGDVL